MSELEQALEAMAPEEALSALAAAVKSFFAKLGEEARLRFLLDLVGERQGDKLTSTVHL